MGTVDALAGVVRAAEDALIGLEKAGIGPRAAAERAVVRWAVDTDVLHEVAALRALRLLWDAVLERHGVAGVPLRIEVRPAMRRWTRVRPEDNLLRVVASTYAAVLGCADGIEALPSTARSAPPAEGPLRWARNIQHLLREECGMLRYADPVAGSRAVEARTSALIAAVEEELRQQPSWAVWVAQKGPEAALRRGREALKSAPLFLPVDVPRGEDAEPDLVHPGNGLPVPFFVADYPKS
jgi:methylmalonyl-CoA mutase